MAISYATATFSSSGADSQSFTFSPTLTNATPKILSATPVVTVSTEGPCFAYIVGTPTNTGGTVAISSPTDCIVTIVGSD